MKDDILAMRQTTGCADQSQDPSVDAASGHSLGQPLSLHDPLSEDHDCTRLLRIEAASDGDPIICTMSEIAFGNKPKFDALSYMWGNGEAEQKITINGHDFSVRQNLWDALHYLRKHCPDTSYWIDAICINQTISMSETNRFGSCTTSTSGLRPWLYGWVKVIQGMRHKCLTCDGFVI
ncbi:hypothetical protein FPSE_04394 [Fusarium pseudograminearum CS3096]|uniref:Heterokaryon incompatibility domain-containing protein n=1 Tax=Fusarium pseudograminearum (strain CS3096) TaxID=1028729 RepID=K3USL7_FUSPC|nr:hypothetical protein FPSE_04394 [Fusarium pseudograminearum CS3096]EKJ75441.1 hypothetical protein FPSE_04394 [Fusarium pseudograminearum CS3096]